MIGHLVAAVAHPTAGPPGRMVVIFSAVLAFVLVALFGSLIGHAITMAHEGGHALVTVLLGGEVDAVGLYSDGTGETLFASQPGTGAAISIAGYIGPSLFGLLGALALAHGRADVVLWASIVLLGLLLTVTYNWFGRFAVLATGLALFWAVRKGSGGTQLLVACTWTWVLLIGGLDHVMEHGRHGADHADLRDQTYIPAVIWAALAGIAATAALVVSGLMLWGVLAPPV